jgi:glycosyltransferase involved in cell wall biosynthesis
MPLQTAGTEVYSYALSMNLKSFGVDVCIIIPNYGKNISVNYEYNGITVHQFAEPSLIDRSLIMGKRKPDGLVSFKALLQEETPDLVNFHELAGSNGITINHVKAAKDLGAKVVMTFHLSGYTCMTGSLVYKGEKLCDGKMKKISCSKCYLHSKGYGWLSPLLTPLSSMIDSAGIDTTSLRNKFGTALGTASLVKQKKNQFLKLTNICDSLVVLTDWYKKILVLNGVNISKIKHIPQALPYRASIRADRFTDCESLTVKLMFLGRISPFKGLHHLLEAINVFTSEQVSLDIYGQTNDREYENHCRKMSSSKSNIRWMGELSQGRVLNTMQQYDALCLCSTFSEMSPLVIQEAFAAGIPVIASHVYGNAEQIHHGVNGLLFRFNNIESLREQIQSCINNPMLLKRLARNIIPPSDFSEVAASYYQLYHKILSDS